MLPRKNHLKCAVVVINHYIQPHLVTIDLVQMDCLICASRVLQLRTTNTANLLLTSREIIMKALSDINDAKEYLYKHYENVAEMVKRLGMMNTLESQLFYAMVKGDKVKVETTLQEQAIDALMTQYSLPISRTGAKYYVIRPKFLNDMLALDWLK